METIGNRLAVILRRTWWMLLLRGLFAIVFGVLTWVLPGVSLAALVLLFGAYVMADGILGVWSAVAGRKEHEHWWVMFIAGLLGIAVGVLTFLAPGVTALVLLFYIAIWAIATGVLQIVVAIRLRKEMSGELLLILAGLASVLFGILLVVRPDAGALAVLWLIATYAVFFGVLLVMLALKVRSVAA